MIEDPVNNLSSLRILGQIPQNGDDVIRHQADLEVQLLLLLVNGGYGLLVGEVSPVLGLDAPVEGGRVGIVGIIGSVGSVGSVGVGTQGGGREERQQPKNNEELHDTLSFSIFAGLVTGLS